MKLTEKILGVIAMIGVTLKFLVITGGGIITTFSLLLLAVIYFYLGFALFNNIRLRQVFKKISYKGITAARMYIVTGLSMSLSILVMGILFKLQAWEGSGLMLTTGLLLTFILFIVVLLENKKHKSPVYKLMITRIMIIGGIGLIIYLFPQDKLRKILYPNDTTDQVNSHSIKKLVTCH
jgi:hypothetical protein